MALLKAFIRASTLLFPMPVEITDIVLHNELGSTADRQAELRAKIVNKIE